MFSTDRCVRHHQHEAVLLDRVREVHASETTKVRTANSSSTALGIDELLDAVFNKLRNLSNEEGAGVKSILVAGCFNVEVVFEVAGSVPDVKFFLGPFRAGDRHTSSILKYSITCG